MSDDRKTKVKSILISQPQPANENNPYSAVADKHKVVIDFRSFIHVEGVTASNFRKDKIQIRDFRNVIFTSKNAVDHYFRMCEEMRVQISPDIRYFCISEAIAYYLQKYVVYRKRKIYHGNIRIEELIPVLKKFKNEKFLMPSSDSLKPQIPNALEEANIDYTRAILFKTVVSDLSDLENVFYDVLVFFSPSGIKSLYENFPEFKQNNTRLACFGATTQKEAEKNGLIVDIPAPTVNAPSMTKAISDYIKEVNKK
ncbi:MAG: uroporphyrinogen-III synthase [Flavobacteriales bacterium]|nr:uroporphyrinogen-III synthase [Cryomorphaceae bacterium]|tara:strand:+ start:292 stop:1056 length:765 start_codon:yes stop_codon:yes gene_type:complete